MNVAPTLTAVPTCTDEKTTGHHDHTVTYPVGAPFMTPGTGAVRQTPSCHDGAHAAQWRTHAGDMNVAPTLPAVPIRATGKSVGELENPDALTGFSHHLKKKDSTDSEKTLSVRDLRNGMKTLRIFVRRLSVTTGRGAATLAALPVRRNSLHVEPLTHAVRHRNNTSTDIFIHKEALAIIRVLLKA